MTGQLRRRVRLFAAWHGYRGWQDLLQTPLGWLAERCRCRRCGYRWVVVRPVGGHPGGCPQCGEGNGDES